MRTASLFTSEALPRAANVKRMRVVDAGTIHGHVNMVCGHCGFDDGFQYIYDNTVTELKRGLPCPKCNDPTKG